MMPRLHVERRLADHPAPTPQPTPCRLWQGATSKGYGVRTDNSKVHRWVMSMALGRPLLSSETVLHECDQRLCYRFEHLRLGTIADNNLDARLKGRHGHGELLGSAHPNAKLTDEQVREIKASTDGYRVLARRYGVGQTTIRRIRKGETWGRANG